MGRVTSIGHEDHSVYRSRKADRQAYIRAVVIVSVYAFAVYRAAEITCKGTNET